MTDNQISGQQTVGIVNFVFQIKIACYTMPNAEMYSVTKQIETK